LWNSTKLPLFSLYEFCIGCTNSCFKDRLQTNMIGALMSFCYTSKWGDILWGTWFSKWWLQLMVWDLMPRYRTTWHYIPELRTFDNDLQLAVNGGGWGGGGPW
jgi:hypothetical protein